MMRRILAILLTLSFMLSAVISAGAYGYGVDAFAVDEVEYIIDYKDDGTVLLSKGDSTVYITNVAQITYGNFGSTKTAIPILWLYSSGSDLEFNVDPKSVYIGSYPIWENDEIVGQNVAATTNLAWYNLGSDGVYNFEQGGIGYIEGLTEPQANYVTELHLNSVYNDDPSYTDGTYAYVFGYGDLDFYYTFAEKESPSDWAVDYVDSAIATKLVPAGLQAKYTHATTRAEFCAFAVALYQSVTNSDLPILTKFSDTSDENVLKMATLGVVNGVGGGKFAPDATLTREQAAAMLSRLATAIGKPLETKKPTFGDNAEVSDWADEAVGQMQASGVMGGVGGNKFAPKGEYTREQSIITIWRLFEILK